MTLFDDGYGPPPTDPPPKLSYTQRVTIRNRESLERGIHPVTRRKLKEPRGKVCGECKFHYVRHYGGRYHKCEYGSASGSITSDIRVSWPARELFEWGTPS